MIAKSLHIENYRSFKDPKDIVFASDDKKITIIRGRNEVGKTNLLNMILWCLYGEEDKEQVSSEEIWNKKALSEIQVNENLDVVVELTLEDSSHNNVIIERKHTFTKIGDFETKKPQRSFKITKEKDGSDSEIIDPETYIKNNIPKTLSKFFIFDGEQLTKFFKENEGNIKNDVYSLSQLDLLKRINSRTETLEEEFLEQMTENENSYAPIKQKEKKLLKAIKDDENLLNQKKNSLNRCENKKNILDKEKVDFDEDAVDTVNRINKYRKEKEQKESDKKDQETNIKKFLIDSFIKIFSYDALDKINNVKKVSNNPKNIQIDVNILKDLLKHNKCICGCELDEGSPEYVEIETLIKNSDDLSDLDSEFNKLVGKCELSKSNFPKDFRLKYDLEDDKLLELEDKIADLEDSITFNINKLNGSSEEDILDLNNKIKFYEDQIKNLNIDIRELEKQIGNNNEYLFNVQDELIQKESEIEEQEKIFLKKINFCQAVENITDEIYEHLVEKNHRKIQELTTEEFKNIHWKEYQSICINENFDVSLQKNDGSVISAGDPSVGSRLSLALSFVVVLHELSGFQLPLFIDTPLGPLETPNRKNIGKLLAKYSTGKQAILLVTGDEYLSFNETVDDSVGKYYNLNPSGEDGEYTEILPVSRDELNDILQKEEKRFGGSI